MWRWEATRPRLRGGRRRDPHDAGGACADSHSERGGGRETVGVGHDGGRARARHIYRAAAHGHAAHFAHTRSLRPDAPVSCHRQGGAGGGTELPRARAAGRWGAFWVAGWRTRLGRAIHVSGPPQHPYATQPWMMGGHPPRVRGMEAEEAARRRHLPIEVPYAGGGGRRHTRGVGRSHGHWALMIPYRAPTACCCTHAAAHNVRRGPHPAGWAGGCGRTAERIGVRRETAAWNLCVLTRHGKLHRI